MKKLLAEVVCAAFVLTGPGQGFVFAAQKSAPKAVTPGIGGLKAPSALPGAVIGAPAAASAKAPSTTIGQVAQVAQAIHAAGVASGQAGVEVGEVIDSLYIKGAQGASSDSTETIITGNSSARGSLLSRPEARRERALASVEARAQRRDSSSMTTTLIVVGGVAAAGYFFRHQIMAVVTPLMDKFMPAKWRYERLLNNLEKAHGIYNAEVNALKERHIKSETDLKDKLKEAAALNDQFMAKANAAKAAKPKEGEKPSPEFESARQEAVNLKKQYDTAMEQVATFQTRFNNNTAALKQLLERRENFIHLQQTSIAKVKERLDAEYLGKLEQREAAITKKYEVGAAAELEKANKKVNEAIAKGKAAMDELNSSEAGQVFNSGNAARDTKAQDAIDDIINGGSSKKDGAAMLDPQAGKYVRPAFWLIGSVAVPMIALAGHGLLVLAAASLVGLAPLFLSPSRFMQARAADIFVIGTGSILAGMGIAAAGGLFGLNVALVGSMMFLGPAGLLATLGLIGAAKNWMRLRGQASPQTMEPIAAPSSFNPLAAVREKLAAAGKKIEQVMTPVSEPAKPAEQGSSIGESAQRAGAAVGKIAEAGKEAAGKAAEQAGNAARQGAGAVADALEKAADMASKAAGDMASQPGAPAPSMDEIGKRMKDVGARLASVATRVAEKGVEALEDKVDPNAPKDSMGGLVARAWTALKGILAMEIEKLKAHPQYRAYEMRVAIAKADERMRGAILSTAQKYYEAQLGAQDAQEASDKFMQQVKDLNIAKHPQNERHARVALEQKLRKDREVVRQLRLMGEAKLAMDRAIAARALAMADAAERMIAIEDGLTEQAVAEMQERISLAEQDYYSTMRESMAAFKAEVIKRVARGKAAGELAGTEPEKILAEAEQAARQTKVEDELEKLKKQG